MDFILVIFMPLSATLYPTEVLSRAHDALYI
jgi:hypothetical protein